MRRDKPDAYAASAAYIFVLATVALSAVLYLGYASFFLVGKACPLCLTMYVAVIGLFLVSGAVASISGLPSRISRDLQALVRSPLAAGLAVAWLAASASLIAFFPHEPE